MQAQSNWENPSTIIFTNNLKEEMWSSTKALTTLPQNPTAGPKHLNGRSNKNGIRHAIYSIRIGI
jgi:hypothetical protein